MAFRFCDSFDHYATAECPLKWTQVFSINIQNTVFRNGTQALFFPTGGAGQTGVVTKTLDYQNIWTMGFAVYLPTSSSGVANGGTIYSLASNGTTLMRLFIEPDTTLSLYAGSGALYGNTGLLGFSLHFNTWYFIEVQNVISSTGGGTPHSQVATILRVNEVQLLAPAAQDTGVVISSLINQTATANRHGIAGMGGNPSGLYMDDVYVTDGQGAINTGFLGDVAIEALYPDADAATLNFSIFPASPTTHFTKVNENPPDNDTTYIFDNVIGDQDDFDWQPIATFAGTIPAVQYLLYARKDDEGSRQIKHTIGGGTYGAPNGGILGTPAFSLSDSYCYYHIPLDTDPAHANAAWTVALFNAQDFGVEVFA